MATNVVLQGFEEFRQALSGERLSKGFKEDMDYLTSELHKSLRNEVVKRYVVQPNQVDAIFAKGQGTSSLQKTIVDLTYKHHPTNLGHYFTDKDKSGYEGNGWYHYAKVVRTRNALVRGKTKQGGFVPHKSTNKGANPENRFKYKQYKPMGQRMMFERKLGSKRYPIQPIWSLSVAQMVQTVYLNNPKVQETVDTAISMIGDRVLERIAYGK